MSHALAPERAETLRIGVGLLWTAAWRITTTTEYP
jgi:hypothetical protein